MNCANCGAERHGDYCQDCGQQYHTGKNLALRSFVSEGFEAFTSLDSRVWTTLKLLLIKPGFLTAEYWAGRRVKYVKPLRLYLTVAAFYFFIGSSSFVNVEELFAMFAEQGGERANNIAILLNRIAESQNLTPELVTAKINTNFQTLFKIINPLFVVVFAFFVKLIFRKEKEYYVEHLIFALHYFAFEHLYGMLIGASLFVVKNVLVISLISSIIGIIYLQYAGRRAYNIRGKGATARLFFAWLVNYGIRLLVVMIAMMTAVFMVARG